MEIKIRSQGEKKQFLLRINARDKKIIELGAALKETSVQDIITEYGIKKIVEMILQEFPKIRELI